MARPSARLALHRETVRTLSAPEAGDVQGARASVEPPSVDYSILVRTCLCVATVQCTLDPVACGGPAA